MEPSRHLVSESAVSRDPLCSREAREGAQRIRVTQPHLAESLGLRELPQGWRCKGCNKVEVADEDMSCPGCFQAASDVLREGSN